MQPLKMCPVFGLYVASRKLIKIYTKALEKVDLTYPQFLVISCLLNEDGVSVDRLGQELLLDSGTLTPLLKRLEANGFITRNYSQEDERKRVIRLTSQGRDIEEALVPLRQEIRAHLRVTPEDVQHLTYVLSKIIAADI